MDWKTFQLEIELLEKNCVAVESDAGDISRPQVGVSPVGSQEAEQWMEVEYTISFVDDEKPEGRRSLLNSRDNSSSTLLEWENSRSFYEGVSPEVRRQQVEPDETNSSLEWEDSRSFCDDVPPEVQRSQVEADETILDLSSILQDSYVMADSSMPGVTTSDSLNLSNQDGQYQS